MKTFEEDMREIKFRAWIESIVPEETGMYYPTVFQLMGNGMVDKFWTNEYKFTSDTSKFTLMQFTGLKDKNGKEIYEGDIIKHTRKHWYCPTHPMHNKDLIDNCEVYSDEEKGVISKRTIDLTRKNQPPYSSSGILTLDSFQDERADKNIIEVIGNIYENPELLGE